MKELAGIIKHLDTNGASSASQALGLLYCTQALENAKFTP